jgi:secreted PhoX family phosphatase
MTDLNRRHLLTGAAAAGAAAALTSFGASTARAAVPAAEKATVVGFHFTFPSIGQSRRTAANTG